MLVMSQSKSTVVNTGHIVKLIVKRGTKLDDKEEAYEYHIVACESLDTIAAELYLRFIPQKKMRRRLCTIFFLIMREPKGFIAFSRRKN